MTKKLSISLVLFLTVFSFFAGAVVDSVAITESGEIANYEASYNSYKKARQNYLDALNKSRVLECREENSCEQAKIQVKVEAKNYLTASADFIDSYLQLLRKRIENEPYKGEDKESALEEISSWSNEVEDKLKGIKDSKTEDEIKKYSQELRFWWIEKSPKIKKIRGYIYTWRISSSLENFYEITDKMESFLSSIKQNYDIKKSEENFMAIKTLLTDAENLKKEADQEFSDTKTNDNDDNVIKGFSKVKEAKEKIILAGEKMRELIKNAQRKNLSKKSASSTLIIKGEGRVLIKGDVSVSGRLGDRTYKGQLVLNSFSENFNSEFSKDAIKDERGNKIIYTNVLDFSFSGSSIDVELSSQLIEVDIVANGSSRITLSGDGLYKFGDENWADIPKKELELIL